jgi:peptide/nickel transport system substrate-binding protein
LIYGVTTPQINDIKSPAPQVICETTAANVSRNLLVNRDKPPFNNADLRRGMSLSLDRKAFIDILYQGLGDAGGAMQPPPEGGLGFTGGGAADLAGL